MTAEERRNYELFGPWTGAALRDKPPIPRSIRLRRVRFWRAFGFVTFLTVIACALAGLSH